MHSNLPSTETHCSDKQLSRPEIAGLWFSWPMRGWCIDSRALFPRPVEVADEIGWESAGSLLIIVGCMLGMSTKDELEADVDDGCSLFWACTQ